MCVVQRSILGPLLFLIYINDCIHSTNYFSVILFADDTSLSSCGKAIDELLIKLTLNLSKTRYYFAAKTEIKFCPSSTYRNSQTLGFGLCFQCQISWVSH